MYGKKKASKKPMVGKKGAAKMPAAVKAKMKKKKK